MTQLAKETGMVEPRMLRLLFVDFEAHSCL